MEVSQIGDLEVSLPGVRNYDGSWTEWGSLVGVPIVKGVEPGVAPAPRG